MIRITTHVLDMVDGRPAAGVRVRLERCDAASGAAPLASATTDADGRVGDWLPNGVEPGCYRLAFETGAWLRAAGRETIYPEVTVQVDARAGEKHYHLPILLAPNGYTTYRGS
jgi:5-hydroxyisourate hydrolase